MNTSESGTVKCFQFGPFRLDLSARTLQVDGKRLKLPSRAFDTLVVLVENRGAVVDKKTLTDLVWPDVAVEENNLAQAIAAIRKALGDRNGDQRYILTVPGRGYSFVAVVNEDLAPANPASRRRTALYVARISVAAGLIAAVVVWLWPGRSSQQTRLAALTGAYYETGPMSFSPNGDRLAYPWHPDDGRPSGIYVKVIGAGDPLPLAVGKNQAGPAWSPDGRYIAYYRRPPGLYLIPALGGAERKLTDLQDGIGGVRVSWSRDGKRLAFQDRDPDTGLISIFELNAGTGERRKLTSGAEHGDLSPAYSPDGKFLAFVRWPASNYAAVFVIPAAGGAARQLTSFDLGAVYFDWTPGSQEIVYPGIKNGKRALWRVPVSGGTPRRIVEAGFDVSMPAIARSGNRMAFLEVHPTSNLWRLDLDRQSEPQKLAATVRVQHSPQYSPDGSKLAFVSNRSGGHLEIWTSDSEGRNLAVLTSMGEQDTDAGTPRWSPDENFRPIAQLQSAFPHASIGAPLSGLKWNTLSSRVLLDDRSI